MMTRAIRILFVVFLAASLVAGKAFAGDKKFELSLDRNRIAIGQKAQLGASFYGTQSMPAPDIGNIDGLEVRYVGPSTMMTVLSGQVSTSITHLYSVLPLKVGKFQIGPFTFKYKGDTYTSNMVFLEASDEPIAPQPSRQGPPGQGIGAAPLGRPVAAEQVGLADRIFLTLFVDKTVAYVNELIPVTVKLYVNRLNVNDIQLPTFAQEGFSKVEFKEPKQYRERLNGLLYDVLEFRTSIFGMRAGDYRLGPASIKCNVMVRKSMPGGPGFNDDFFGPDPSAAFLDDFMSRYERYPMELKSKDIQLGVLALPSQGRPQDFSGAVGDYQFIYSANPTKLKVGDPVTLKMEINGTGNFNTVLMPKLDDTAGFKVYEAQAKTEENHKTFTQVLIPETEQMAKLPKAVFSYFDPNARHYKTISQGPIAISVEKGKEEAPSQVIGPVIPPAGAAAKADELGRDLIYIKDSPGTLRRKGDTFYRTPAFGLAFALPLVLLIIFSVYNERLTRIRTDSVYAGRLAAYRSSKKGMKALGRTMKAGDPKVFYETLFKTLQDYLGYRLSIPPPGITSAVADEALSTRDVDPAMMAKMRDLFRACDESRFGFRQPDIYKMKDDIKVLGEVIKYLERKKV